MMYGSNWGWNNGWGMMGGWGNQSWLGGGFGGLLVMLAILDLFLKGVAMWKAAGHKQKYWFVALLLINSLGILPAVYLKFFQKKGKKK